MDIHCAVLIVLLILIVAFVPFNSPRVTNVCFGLAGFIIGSALLLANSRNNGHTVHTYVKGGSQIRDRALTIYTSLASRVYAYTSKELDAIEGKAFIWQKEVPSDFREIGGSLPYIEEQKKEDVALLQLHIGQRKLLLAEVDFLTRHGHRSYNVVYAGGAPGIHFPLIEKLFPEHKF